MSKKDDKKTTNEKPIKIPLDFKEALKGLLQVQPESKEEKKEKKSRKKPANKK